MTLPTPVVLMKDAVALARVHDLRIAGHDRHVGDKSGVSHGMNDVAKRLHGKAFFQDESSAEGDWTRTAHVRRSRLPPCF